MVFSNILNIISSASTRLLAAKFKIHTLVSLNASLIGLPYHVDLAPSDVQLVRNHLHLFVVQSSVVGQISAAFRESFSSHQA